MWGWVGGGGGVGFFFNDTATTEIYTLSLHDALPIWELLMAARPGILVVGAGYAGSVCARVLAEAGHRVLLIDRRPHIGGNAFDEYDRYGMLVHRYGPHIFHTNSKCAFDWLSRFTRWRAYEHRVLASVDGMLLPIPINRTTINRLYGLDLDQEGVGEYLERVREPRDRIYTSEDVEIGRASCRERV